MKSRLPVVAGIVLGTTVALVAPHASSQPDPTHESAVVIEAVGATYGVCDADENYDAGAEGTRAEGEVTSHKSHSDAAQAFIDELKIASSSQNPQLREIDAEARRQYETWFKNSFGPAEKITISRLDGERKSGQLRANWGRIDELTGGSTCSSKPPTEERTTMP